MFVEQFEPSELLLVIIFLILIHEVSSHSFSFLLQTAFHARLFRRQLPSSCSHAFELSHQTTFEALHLLVLLEWFVLFLQHLLV